jgi:hypothetical protein
MDVPEGYVRLPDTTIKTALHTFRREATENTAWAVLSVSPLGGTIGKKASSNHAIVEASARQAAAQTGTKVTSFEYRSVTWSGFSLEVMVMRAIAPDGSPAFSIGATIPLESGAEQVQVVGPESAEAELSAEFEQVIASFKGETNWSPDTTFSQAEQLGERVGFAVGKFAMSACCLAFGVVVA